MKKITSIKDIEIDDELILDEKHGKLFKYKVIKVDTEDDSVDTECFGVRSNKRITTYQGCGINCFKYILNKTEKKTTKPSVGTLQNMVKSRDDKIAALEKELEEYRDAIFQVRNILPD